MIALLTGEIAHRSVDHLIVDVGGVGYRLTIPLSTFYALPEEGNVRLHVHTQVKEDAIQLFGFLTPEEKELFLLLITVSGVGPKLSVNILSNIPAQELKVALRDRNTVRLAAIPGIGKKTAERLVLELQEKVRRLGPVQENMPAPHREAAAVGAADDAVSALINLGYKETQARKVVDALETAPGAPLEDILKGALKVLMK